VGVKPLTEFAQQWQKFLERPAASDQPMSLAVIGGGVAGVELALAMKYRLRTHSHLTPNISIIEVHDALSQVSEATREYLFTQLKAQAIAVHSHVTVQTITPTTITLSDQSVVLSEFTVAATGPHPYHWVSETQLPCTDGYIQIDDTLRSPAYTNVFAVGDCAHFLPRPLPKAGVYAVREAPYLYKNISALLHERPLYIFTPQKDYLKLITLGNKRAASDKWGWCLRGVWLWYLKHFIDTSFMRRLRKQKTGTTVNN
jgi:selenide,water dikinase